MTTIKLKKILSLAIVIAIILSLPISVMSDSTLDVITHEEFSHANYTESSEPTVEEPTIETDTADTNESDVISDSITEDVVIIEREREPHIPDNYDSNDRGIVAFGHQGNITYYLNGGTGGPHPNPERRSTGPNRPLSDIVPTHLPTYLDGEITAVAFIGWSLTKPARILTIRDAVPSVVTQVTVIGDGNVTVYAVWGFDTNQNGIADVLNRGAIIYNLTNGTSGPHPNPVFAVAGANRPLSTTEPIHAPAELGGKITNVIFIGWSLTEPTSILKIDDAIPTLVTSVTVVPNQSITVYAVWGFASIIVEVDEYGHATVKMPPWVDVNYKISYDNDGNITITFPQSTNENNIKAIIPPTWSYDVTHGNNGDVILAIMPPPPIMHYVTFNLNGGNVAGNTDTILVPIIENEEIGAIVPVPTRSNHRFRGWQENGTGPILSSTYVSELTVSEPRTFTAVWLRNTVGGPIVTPPPPPLDDNDIDIEENPDVNDEPPEETIPEEEVPPEEEIPAEETPEEETPVEEDAPEESAQEETPVDEEFSEIEPAADNSNESNKPSEDASINEPASEEDSSAENIDPVAVEFNLTNIGNPINRSINRFRIVNRLSLGLQFEIGEIPAFTRGDGLFYTVKYRTNLNNSLRIMANNIPADRPFLLLPPRLNDDEIITEIKIEFDTVPAGFRMENNIVYRFTILDEDNASNRWEILFGDASNGISYIGAALNNVNKISNRENIYDEASWANLQAAISYAENIFNNPNSTPDEIENAYVLLQQAVNELNSVASAPASTPFAISGILIALLVFALFAFLIIVLVKLLKHKKRIAINSRLYSTN
ncbi:MAG: InlB B-repeat-containing protein [Oscillospiraceae bacterium]|nr:InlB B-repeat-containing protein [Oscillospiraceae bacterium]